MLAKKQKKQIIDHIFGPIYFERRIRTTAHIYDAIGIYAHIIIYAMGI
jgi:hypothetical protein